MLVLLIMFTINSFYIGKVSSNSVTSYSMPHVVVGDVFEWVYTYPEELVGDEFRAIKIVDIEEDSIEWTIIYIVRFYNSTEYNDDYPLYDRIPKSSPFSIPSFFCPLPVPEYLLDFINDEDSPAYSSSGNQLIMNYFFYEPYRHIWEFNTETGIRISYTEFVSGEMSLRHELLTKSSNNISSYNIPLTMMIALIMIIGITSTILKRKKHHNI